MLVVLVVVAKLSEASMAELTTGVVTSSRDDSFALPAHKGAEAVDEHEVFLEVEELHLLLIHLRLMVVGSPSETGHVLLTALRFHAVHGIDVDADLPKIYLLESRDVGEAGRGCFWDLIPMQPDMLVYVLCILAGASWANVRCNIKTGPELS